MNNEAWEQSRQQWGTGSLGTGGGAGGTQFLDYSQGPRVFRVTSTGANPYSAVEQYFDGSAWADTTVDNGIQLTLSLYEIGGATDVASDTKVIAIPNPFGAGYIFSKIGTGGSGGSITTANTTSSPSGSTGSETTATLSANTTSGLQIQGGATSRQVIALAASTTQQGMVQIVDQTWKGMKRNDDGFLSTKTVSSAVVTTWVAPSYADTLSYTSTLGLEKIVDSTHRNYAYINILGSNQNIQQYSTVNDSAFGTLACEQVSGSTTSSKIALQHNNGLGGGSAKSSSVSIFVSSDYDDDELVVEGDVSTKPSIYGTGKFSVYRSAVKYPGIDRTLGLSGSTLEVPVILGGIVTGYSTVSLPGGGSGTVTSITLTQPAAGITVSDSGVALTTSGTRTLALANDLAALEALSGTNTIYYRSGADTWSAVTIGSNLTFSGGTLDGAAGLSAIANLSVLGNTSGVNPAVPVAITSGAAKLALMSNETNTGIGFRQIDYNDLGDLTGVAVLGRAPNSSGSPAQIASAGNRHFLASDSTNANIGFRAIAYEDLPGSQIKSVNESFLAANQDVANNSWTTLVSLTLPAGTYLITYLCSWTISYSAGSSVFCEVDLYDGTAQIADTIIPGTFLPAPDTMRGASGTTRKITLSSTKTVSVRVRFDGTGVTWSIRRALGSSGGVGTTKITAVEY